MLRFVFINIKGKEEEYMQKVSKIVNVMKRYELKYFLSKEQLEHFLNKISEYMKVDQYGLTHILSIYFDTPDFHLINRSIEKPKFKEKLRLRSYGLIDESKPSFLEIKRKCDDIVYKRRIILSEEEAMEFIKNKQRVNDEQIAKELDYFISSYPILEAKYLIIYDRLAYYQEDSDLRITVDMNPRYRIENLDLHTSIDGSPLLEEGGAILEIKVQNSIPLWLSKILSEEKIYRTSFSKVGTAHTLEMKKRMNNIVHTKGEKENGFTI